MGEVMSDKRLDAALLVAEALGLGTNPAMLRAVDSHAFDVESLKQSRQQLRDLAAEQRRQWRIENPLPAGCFQMTADERRLYEFMNPDDAACYLAELMAIRGG